MRRTLRVAIAGAIIAGSMMQPAFASPDFGKEIMYNAHVDSPKVYWQGSNFELRSDAAGESRLIDQTVNWLGRGYTTVGTQLFAMRAPESGDLGFMGVESGDKLFAAPAVNGRNNGPIWSGFGADTSIPVERFRDGKFNLELVGFSGPGRMEMLNYYEDTPIRRFISSHDPHVRQTWVEPGTHTHNQTLFTRPGRYELAYRATARDEQNRVVASAPQILTWQVGGPNPELATLRDVVASYNASPETGTEEFAPRFSVAPNTQRIQDGAELLSTLTFETGNEADAGAAVFYVDGFYLGEVPVTSGSAVWNELLGDQDLALQVVFVPAEGSPSPRWVSAPLQLSREVTSASTFELGEFPTPVTRDPAAPFTADEYTPSSTKVNMHLEASEDHALLSVVPEDENLWFKVVGGAFEKGSDYPMCDIEFISTPTSRTWDSGSWWECSGEGMDIRLNIITPTRVKFAGTNVEFPVDEPGTYSAHLNSDFGGGVEPGVVEPEPAGPEAPSDPSNPDTPVDPADPSNPGTPVDPSDPSNPADPADPSNPADGESPTTPSNPGASEDPADSSNNEDNPQEPASPEEATLAEQKVEISAGHIDIGPAEVGGALRMAVRDESRQHAKTAVLRRPEAVTLVLGENSKVTRSKRAFADADFDFLGPVGTRVYVSPMQQRNGIVWPGFSTEHVDRHKYSKGMTFEISAVKAPKGGKWWLFTHDAFNGLNLIASSDSPGKIEAPEPLHKHVYWAFSEPGEYTLKVGVSGKSEQEESFAAKSDLKFRIGNVEEPEPKPGEEPGENPKEETDTKPSAEPNGNPCEESGSDTQEELTNPGEEHQKPGASESGGKPGSTSVAENKKTPQSGSTATGAPAGRKQVWPGAPFGGASAQQTKVSRGGAPAAGTSSSLLTSLPLPQDLMESANEGAPENTQEVPEQAGESASSLESATAPSEGESSDVQFASASPQLQKKSGVSIPIVIMVVSAVVSLAAAGVLIRRRFM